MDPAQVIQGSDILGAEHLFLHHHLNPYLLKIASLMAVGVIQSSALDSLELFPEGRFMALPRFSASAG